MYHDPHKLISELENNLGLLKDKVARIEQTEDLDELGKIEGFARQNIQALVVHGTNISKGIRSAVEKRRAEIRSGLNARAMDRVGEILKGQ